MCHLYAIRLYLWTNGLQNGSSYRVRNRCKSKQSFWSVCNLYFTNILIQEHSEIKLVKIDDPEEALEYGLKQLPSLVFFENQMPNMFDGNLENSKQVLTWIIEIAMQDKIELVSGAMLEKLVEEKTNLAVFVHDK